MPEDNLMENRVIEILLIEDDPDDAELTIHALKKHNLVNHLSHIDDGEKALHFLSEGGTEHPKLILLDLRMPKVDGITILKTLRADPDRKKIPVIALISSKEGKGYLESHQIKADAYIIKPLDFKKFLTAVSEIGLNWKILNSSAIDR
jgi:two-component system, response regulator